MGTTAPEWVREANAGAPGPIADEAAKPISVDVLTAEALGAVDAGDRSRFGPADFVEPLTVFLEALESEADLTTVGRWMTRRYVLRLLTGRIELFDLLAEHPAIADERIVEPIVVVGAPRTGTTIVHGLLAQDSRHRAPEGWELLYPARAGWPGTTHATAECDARLDATIEAAANELSMPQQIVGTIEAMHPYSARMHKECLSAMSFAFRTEEFVSRYHVPSYIDWLQRADMTPAYDMHRLVLQTLQYRQAEQHGHASHAAPRWVLKSPVHLQSLPTLRATYPDARLVLTHRDPRAILASVSALIENLRGAFSADVDRSAIGRYHCDLYATSLDRLVDIDRDEKGIVIDANLRHRDIVADASAAMLDLYTQLGIAAPDPACFDSFLRDRATAAATDRPDLSTYGLDVADIDRHFARYRSRFLA